MAVELAVDTESTLVIYETQVTPTIVVNDDVLVIPDSLQGPVVIEQVQGLRGEKGEQGDPSSLSVGTVEQIGATEAPDVEITGDAPNQIIDFFIPANAKILSGVDAPDANDGEPGDWYINTTTWDMSEKTDATTWVTRLNIRGAQGIQGNTGPAPNLVGANLTLVDQAGTPGASVTGSNPNYTLEFTIPRGAQIKTGTDDPAAGTGGVGDWYINSVTWNVFEKTASTTWTPRGNIKGAKGDTGNTGATGPANSLTVDSVTASAPGSAPAVTIGGAAPNQSISFVLPRGDVGPVGPAPNLLITAATGAAGSNAAATITGTNPNYTINLTIPRGDKGEVGSEWYAGSGVPSNSLGVDEDFYLVSSGLTGLGNVYKKVSGAWSLAGNIRGAAGTGDVNSVNGILPDGSGNVALFVPAAYSDLTGTIPASALPALAINEVFTVASQAAMLALTAQRGDMAIRTDIAETFVLSTDSPGTLADWKQLSSGGKVTSVNGQIGTVVLTKSDIGLGNVPNLDFSNAVNITSGTLGDARLPTRLGTVTKTVTDWNNAVENGYYNAAGTALNGPNSQNMMGVVVAITATNDIEQTVANYGATGTDTRAWRRYRTGGAWGAWFQLSISKAEQDARYVALTGAQTVAGVKTFSNGIVVPDQTLSIAKTTGLQSALDAKANASHVHDAGAVTTGTFDIARIPTGTTGTTVALGNHLHTGTYEPVIGTGTTTQFYRGDKQWAALNVAAITGLQTSLDGKIGTMSRYLNGTGAAPDNDWNTFTAAGVYQVVSGEWGTNAPPSGDPHWVYGVGTLIVAVTEANSVVQTYHDRYGAVATRNKTSNDSWYSGPGGWTPWVVQSNVGHNHDSRYMRMDGTVSQTITGLKSFSGRIRAGFNTNGAGSALTTSAAEFELSSQSMVVIGENAAGSANPHITMYRTNAGSRQGRAFRQYWSSSSGPFKWQIGGNDVAYGSETYSDLLTLHAGGTLVGSADNTYFGWDADATTARVGFSKKAGYVGKVAYANHTFAIAQYVGLPSIDPNAGTPTDRLTIDTSGNVTVPGTFNAGIVYDNGQRVFSLNNLPGYASIPGFKVHDIRNNPWGTNGAGTPTMDPPPNDFPDGSITGQFVQNLASGSDWRSALTVKGWSDTYSAWQIIGPSGTSNDNVFKLRTGRTTAWENEYTIYHTGNVNPVDINANQTVAGTKTFTGRIITGLGPTSGISVGGTYASLTSAPSSLTTVIGNNATAGTGNSTLQRTSGGAGSGDVGTYLQLQFARGLEYGVIPVSQASGVDVSDTTGRVFSVSTLGVVTASKGFTAQGYNGLDNSFGASGGSLYIEGVAGGNIYLRPNGAGSNAGLVTFGPGFATFSENLSTVKSHAGLTKVIVSNPDTGAASYTTQAMFELQVGGTVVGQLKTTNTPLAGLSTKALFLTTAGAYPIAFGTDNAATTSMVIMPTTGNVGIQAANPQFRLNVQGSNNNYPTLGTANGGHAFFGATDNLYGVLIGSNGSGPGWIQAQRVDGNATAYTLNLQPVGGNVGIGTDVTPEKLSVYGNISATGYVTSTGIYSMRNASGTDYQSAAIETRNDNAYPAIAFHKGGAYAPQIRAASGSAIEVVNQAGNAYINFYASELRASAGVYDTGNRVYSASNVPAMSVLSGTVADGQLPARLREGAAGNATADPNNATTSGYWYISAVTLNAPPGVTQDYYVHTVAYSTAWVFQMAFASRDNRIWFRWRNGTTNIWTAWNGDATSNYGGREMYTSRSSGSGSQTFDCSLGSVHEMSANGSSITFNFSNVPPAGQACTITTIHGALTAWSANPPSGTTWMGGTPPQFPDNSKTIITWLTVDGGSTWYASWVNTAV